MTQTDIEIFLAITKYRTINRAADALFLAPSTVGAHLKALEDELGVQLIERKKGIKAVVLTEAGRSFERIASQMASLIKECSDLGDHSLKPLLTIATADSLLEHNLAPFYRQLLYNEKLFKLEIRRMPSDMIYPLVLSKEVDVGFAVTRLNYENVEITSLFSDDTVVVVPASSTIHTSPVHLSELDPEKELFIGSMSNSNVGWGAVFNAWHRSVFNAEKQPLLSVNNLSILPYFFEGGDFWAFLPRTCAHGYSQSCNLRILEIEDYVPNRSCLMLTNRKASACTQRTVASFKRMLDIYLEQQGYI